MDAQKMASSRTAMRTSGREVPASGLDDRISIGFILVIMETSIKYAYFSRLRWSEHKMRNFQDFLNRESFRAKIAHSKPWLAAPRINRTCSIL
jgi:hypothetical protein